MKASPDENLSSNLVSTIPDFLRSQQARGTVRKQRRLHTILISYFEPENRLQRNNLARRFLPGNFMTDPAWCTRRTRLRRLGPHCITRAVVRWSGKCSRTRTDRNQIAFHADDGRWMYCRINTVCSRLLHVNDFNSRLSFHGENPHERSTVRQ